MRGDDRSRTGPLSQGRALLRFLIGLPLIFLFYLLLTLALKLVFLAKNWSPLQAAGYPSIALALWKGFRFDASILCYIFIPATLLYFAAFLTGWHPLRVVLTGYLVVITLVISLLWLADLQYFEETGKHFTSEVVDYLGPSIWPDISGAFRLHPWLSSLSVVAVIALGVLTLLIFRRLLKASTLIGLSRGAYLLLALPFFLLLETIGARGGLQPHPLKIADSLISPNPYLNALCLNPVYSTFASSVSLSPAREKSYLARGGEKTRIVRSLLGSSSSPFLSDRYPLLRASPGSAQGNRKNIVIFLLESWSGKDIGCLEGRAGITPVFDRLARQGLLFSHFYATGVRTPETLFSILCSFPNTPYRTIMRRPEIYQTHWRSISQILDEVGYHNLFIYGRDLDFARIREFLQFFRFHKIVDKRDFSPSTTRTTDSWSGYDDAEVMRRADEELAKLKGPFLAIVCTMNTHPPFHIPPGSPLVSPPTSTSASYLNAVHYSDYCLGLFFDRAQERPYFKETIFLFLSDHARTREKLDLLEQHHIPLLIYAPGHISPGLNPTVGCQVDILPTILGLLRLRANHASWGRNLLDVPKDGGFAVSVVGEQVRWRDSQYLLEDTLTDRPPLLFETAKDPGCSIDLWQQRSKVGESLRAKERAYISLSQALLQQNRIYPGAIQKLVKDGVTR